MCGVFGWGRYGEKEEKEELHHRSVLWSHQPPIPATIALAWSDPVLLSGVCGVWGVGGWGGILSGSPTIVSTLDLLHLASVTISEKIKRYKIMQSQKGRNTKLQKENTTKSNKQQFLFPLEAAALQHNYFVHCLLLSHLITGIVKKWAKTPPYDIRSRTAKLFSLN